MNCSVVLSEKFEIHCENEKHPLTEDEAEQKLLPKQPDGTDAFTFWPDDQDKNTLLDPIEREFAFSGADVANRDSEITYHSNIHEDVLAELQSRILKMEMSLDRLENFGRASIGHEKDGIDSGMHQKNIQKKNNLT